MVCDWLKRTEYVYYGDTKACIPSFLSAHNKRRFFTLAIALASCVCVIFALYLISFNRDHGHGKSRHCASR